MTRRLLVLALCLAASGLAAAPITRADHAIIMTLADALEHQGKHGMAAAIMRQVLEGVAR